MTLSRPYPQQKRPHASPHSPVAKGFAKPIVPALTNPNGSIPVARVRDRIERAKSTRTIPTRFLGFFGAFAYRVRRGVSLRAVSLLEEARAVPAKTVVDVATGAPIAALAVPPLRDWVLAFSHPRDEPLITGPWALTVLILFRVGYTAWRRGNKRQVIGREVSGALKSLLAAIESARPRRNGNGGAGKGTDFQLQVAVPVILSAVADMTRRALHVPEGDTVHANLMLPMRVLVRTGDAVKEEEGCGIVCYDKIPAAPSWTRLPLKDIGAGDVFSSGKVEVVEDTRDPHWFGVLDESRSRCFASFPLRATATNAVIAVVNVDVTRPMVLNKRNAKWLFEDILAPHLTLLADLVDASREQLVQPPPSTPEAA